MTQLRHPSAEAHRFFLVHSSPSAFFYSLIDIGVVFLTQRHRRCYYLLGGTRLLVYLTGGEFLNRLKWRFVDGKIFGDLNLRSKDVRSPAGSLLWRITGG